MRRISFSNINSNGTDISFVNWEKTDTVRRGTILCRIDSTLFRIFSSLLEYLFLEGEAGEGFVVRDREGGWIRLYAPGRGTE